MTREEAIELLDDVIGAIEDNQGRDYDTAFRMAIEALTQDSMQDLISRQDAIKATCNAVCEYDVPHYPNCDQIKYCDEIQALISLPTVGRLTGWIPVSEKLPEEHEWIGTKQFGTTISDKIIITFEVDGHRFVRVMSLQNGDLGPSEKHTMDAFYKDWRMIAWMPLPEPYKGGEGE